MMRQAALSIGLTLLLGQAAGAVSLDSLDDFSTDNEGWRVGNAGNNPTQVGDPSFDGQPGFLRHESDAAGSNGRWIMWSQQDDWTGDYLAAGVSGVSLWADGRVGDDPILWLGFDGPGGWFFTPGQRVITDNDWEKFDFDVTESSLIYQGDSGGTGVYEDTLSNVTRFEIFAGPGPVDFAARGDLLRGGQSTSVIWVDSIAAVPEPATSFGAVLLGLAGLLRRR